MTSLHAVCTHAISDADRPAYIPEAVRRLSQAQVADPIVLLELSARANNVTIESEILPTVPGLFPGPTSSLPVSATRMPRQRREVTSFLFATRPWTGRPSDPNRAHQRALPRIINAGRITRSVPVDANVRRRGQRTIGDAVLANPDGALDELLSTYSLDGGSIRAWVAEPHSDSQEWGLLYEAQIDRVEATQKDIRIGITTIADQLERPLQLRRYTGGGGLAGDASVAGRLKPLAFGEVFGIDPILISVADNIYQVHDGRIRAVDWVREGGLDYTPTTDYPDFDTLAAAPLESGQYATCLARGLFRVGIALSGLVYPLRAGVQGDASGNGYVSATGDILYRIARDRAFLSPGAINVDSFRGLPRARVGYFASGSSDLTVADVFDALLGGIVAAYGVGRSNVLSVRRLLPASSQLNDLNIRGDQVFQSRVEARPVSPRITQPYSYAPTWAPVGESDVSPVADGSVVARLTRSALTGAVTQQTTTAINATAQPTLATYFAEEEAAERIAQSALLFAQGNLVPVRLELGRVGLAVDIGNVLAVDGARFATDFRGVIYEQEDNLGATVTSRVVAIG